MLIPDRARRGLAFLLSAWSLLMGSAAMADVDWDAERQQVMDVAKASLRGWVSAIPPGAFGQYGFESDKDFDKARVLPAIPYVLPSRHGPTLDRGSIEGSLSALPISWIVPIANSEGRVTSLIVVDAVQGQAPESVEFGRSFAANRLDAGLQKLDAGRNLRWEDLRFVAFYSPNVDLLLYRSADGRSWRWLDLTGTEAVSAEDLSAGKIEALIGRVANTPIDEGPFEQSSVE